jgi:hypothetical protein
MKFTRRLLVPLNVTLPIGEIAKYGNQNKGRKCRDAQMQECISAQKKF